MIEDPIKMKVKKNSQESFRKLFKTALVSQPLKSSEKEKISKEEDSLEILQNQQVEEIKNELRPYLKNSHKTQQNIEKNTVKKGQGINI